MFTQKCFYSHIICFSYVFLRTPANHHSWQTSLYFLNSWCLEELIFLLKNLIIGIAEQKLFIFCWQPEWAAIDGSNHLLLALRFRVLVHSLATVFLSHLLLITDKCFFVCILSLNERNHSYFVSSSIFECLFWLKEQMRQSEFW